MFCTVDLLLVVLFFVFFFNKILFFLKHIQGMSAQTDYLKNLN